MLLVISSKCDTHCQKVTDFFDEGDYPWVRINTEDFAENIELTVHPTTSSGTIFVRDSCRVIDIEAVKAVWYRKPDPVNLTHFQVSQPILDYIEAEFQEILQGIYALMSGVFWINNPLVVRLQHRKLLQLRVADEVGLKVPRTIVSNRVGDVIAFAEQVGGDIAIKSLGSLSVSTKDGDETLQYGLFTRRITRDELLSASEQIAYLPTVYQEYVEKDYEVRATVVGRQCFSCKIDSQSSMYGREDFRIDTYGCVHTLYDLPHSVEYKLYEYMDRLEINFGCFDIIKSRGGEYIFLECNPNGQWLWIENTVGAGIANALADMLLAHCRA